MFAVDSPRPNIVDIISDDHAWTDYGFMGHPQIETPHLDKFAARSAVFSRGYASTALCRPALASLASGLYAHQHRISGNASTLLPEMTARGGKQRAEPAEDGRLREKLIAQMDRQPTIAKLLGQQGYLSHQSRKWWEGGYQRGGFTHGMTRGFPQPGGLHGDDGLKDRAGRLETRLRLHRPRGGCQEAVSRLVCALHAAYPAHALILSASWK